MSIFCSMFGAVFVEIDNCDWKFNFRREYQNHFNDIYFKIEKYQFKKTQTMNLQNKNIK